MSKYKVGFLIMRAQPLHSGHRDLIRQAKSQCDELVLLIGSANSPRTIKNPFTYKERVSVIENFICHELDASRIGIYPLNDYKYSDASWFSDVEAIISLYDHGDVELIIFGHQKPGNDYLNLFPQYKFQNIDSVIDVHATGIREEWFRTQRHNFAPEVLEDWDYFQKEKKTFANYPYPETLNFNCGDVILECAGHVLLIQRKRAPGRGTWALPGGFKNSNETFVDCAIRELIEETNVRIPEKVLRGSIINKKLFDDPNRGMGVPRSTLVLHIQVNLNSDSSLPRVSPKDDAFDAQWFTTYDIMNNMELFDDHKDAISDMCGVMSIPANLNPRYF